MEKKIPLTHPDWFHCSNTTLLEDNLLNGTVADLIDQETKTWRVALVRKLYQVHDGEEILNLPLPWTSGIEDKLLWKHSSSGNYKLSCTDTDTDTDTTRTQIQGYDNF